MFKAEHFLLMKLVLIAAKHHEEELSLFNCISQKHESSLVFNLSLKSSVAPPTKLPHILKSKHQHENEPWRCG